MVCPNSESRPLKETSPMVQRMHHNQHLEFPNCIVALCTLQLVGGISNGVQLIGVISLQEYSTSCYGRCIHVHSVRLVFIGGS